MKEKNALCSSIEASVIVPIFNTPIDLVKSSLSSAAGQTFTGSFEVIAVDDGSAPHLIEQYQRAADRLGIRLIGHPHNRGLAAARNTGVQHSRGELVVLLDSDDLLHANALTALLSTFRHSDAMMVYSDHKKETLEGETLHVRRKETFQNILEEFWDSSWNPFLHSTFVIHCQAFARDAFDRVGFFDTSFRFGEEIEFYRKLLTVTTDRLVIAHVPEVLYTYRANPQSICHQDDAYALLIRNIEDILKLAVQQHGLKASTTARVGRCRATDAALYEHRDISGERLNPPWLDFDDMSVRAEWLSV